MLYGTMSSDGSAYIREAATDCIVPAEPAPAVPADGERAQREL